MEGMPNWNNWEDGDRKKKNKRNTNMVYLEWQEAAPTLNNTFLYLKRNGATQTIDLNKQSL